MKPPAHTDPHARFSLWTGPAMPAPIRMAGRVRQSAGDWVIAQKATTGLISSPP